jgi:BirA family biotin operon repressor/biotin-[acetyl-CoA-carboxylase] ligase
MGRERSKKNKEIDITERVVAVLKKGYGFISGEEISRSLGITRAGIWKIIKGLKQKGYLIEAVPSRGYRLLASPDIPTKEEIHAIYKGDTIGREILFYEKVTSTNRLAMEMALLKGSAADRRYQNAPRKQKSTCEGTVIVADAQSQGKGRFGRTWLSPPGVNLYFTVLLKPPISANEMPVITLMAAVAVVSAMREFAGLNAVIKWPNDIMVGNRKIGGILTEMKSDADMVHFTAVGIGVNVNMPSNMMPGNLRAHTTSLKEEKGESVNRVELLGVILSKLEYWYKKLFKNGKKALLREWELMNSTTGNKVRVRIHKRILSGMAEGIGEDGELIIRLPSGKTERVYAGEVTILK